MSAKIVSIVAVLSLTALTLGACGRLRGQPHHEPAAAAASTPAAAAPAQTRR